MLGRRFQIRPERRLAIKLTLILWLAVLSFVAPSTIILGQVASFGEVLSLFSGTISGLALAAVLYGCFAALAGRPLWLGYLGVAATVLAMAFLQTAADYGAQHALNLFYDMTMPPHDARSVMSVLVVYFALYVCNAALFWTSFTQRRMREEEVRAAQAEMQAMRTELARLRLQIDPHFMCNSLGAVVTLIETGDSVAASTVARRLATFLRTSLETHDLDDIPLREELDTLDAYLDVEAARFGERLSVTLSCPEELQSALVPSFILQPLVENAFKHGASSAGKTAAVRIGMERMGEDLIMTVENERASTDAGAVNERGIGLRNIRARLQMKFGSAAELTSGPVGPGFRSAIRLPYRVDAPELGARSAPFGDPAQHEPAT